MENQQIEDQPKQRLSQISREEIDIINDIRELNFGRINIIIQDGVVVNKEITRIVKNGKGRNRGNNRQRNVIENGNANNANDGYNNVGGENNVDNGNRLY